mgnify:CR=1 FL=1
MMIEVKEVSEVIATLEVIDDTLASDVCGRTNVVNSANFDNFVNFKKNKNTMKKQKYQRPEMEVVKIQPSQMLCGSITNVDSGDSGISYGGGSSGGGRAPELDWDD